MPEARSTRVKTLALNARELEVMHNLGRDSRLEVVDGLLEWYFGGEPVLVSNEARAVLSLLISRQEHVIHVSAVRANAGRKGGIAGTGCHKARIGNQNASKTQAKSGDEERKQNASKINEVETAEITNTDAPDIDVGEIENASKNASKTQAKRKQNLPLVPPPSPLHPSTTPYNPPTLGGSSCVWPPTAARGRAPALAHEESPDVLVEETAGRVRKDADGVPVAIPDRQLRELYAKQLGIPLEYLAEFMSEMGKNGWGYVNRGGTFVLLNARNFKYVLRSFYATHTGKRGGKPQPTGVRFFEQNYDMDDLERRMKVS